MHRERVDKHTGTCRVDTPLLRDEEMNKMQKKAPASLRKRNLPEESLLEKTFPNEKKRIFFFLRRVQAIGRRKFAQNQRPLQYILHEVHGVHDLRVDAHQPGPESAGAAGGWREK